MRGRWYQPTNLQNHPDALNDLPADGAIVSPVLTAAVLLVAIPLFERLGLAHPTASAMIEATGASRSQAYALRERVVEALGAVMRPVGRPTRPDAEPVDTGEIVRAVRDFVFDHPGAVSGSGARRRYSDGFRHFALDLAAKHQDVPVDAIAEAVGVPPATLRDWLAGGIGAAEKHENLATIRPRDPTEPQIATLLDLWDRWDGPFSRFCDDVQTNWRLPFGRTLIADLLDLHGVRWRRRRSGRSPDEDALRRQFITFFSGAQWVGDGSPIDITVGDETFTFNVELMVDPASGAVVGASVRDEEDGEAVIEAFNDGVAETGAPPLAVLLDNRPSNHTDEVKEALGDASIVPATPGRPQNKGHVEGVFGLFRQTVPELALPGLASGYDIARAFVIAIVTTWARTLNRRPRGDRGGRSRVELHLDHKPTPEEVANAKAALAERIEKQALAKVTRQARLDPLVRSTLVDAFARLSLADVDGQLLHAIARYPIDAVVEGISIFEGKSRAGTLPAGVDARYLLGIVRNVAEEREGWEIAQVLWRERGRARDAALEVTSAQREAVDAGVDDVEARVVAYADRAMKASRRIDRFFWLESIADVLVEHGAPSDEGPLFRLVARRIQATFAVPHRDRLAATRFLAAQLRPIA